MRDFPVIDDISRLIILADHDSNGAGQAAAEEASSDGLMPEGAAWR